MSTLKAFDIDITQPKAVLTYDLDDDFFALFEHSLLDQGKLTATVQLHKTWDNIQLKFSILGQVVLVCDRSLAPFHYPIHLTPVVTFVPGTESKDLEVDLYMIPQHATTLNIAQHLYDFISLAIPMKKIHPKFDADAATQLTADYVYTSEAGPQETGETT
mgnify:CR=1 FL=1